MRTARALIVMPFSRSRSIESSTSSVMSRWAIVPVSSSRRSLSVGLPWSMGAMIEKLRIRPWSIKSAKYREGGSAAPAFLEEAPQLVAKGSEERQLLAAEEQTTACWGHVSDHRRRNPLRFQDSHHPTLLRRGD